MELALLALGALVIGFTLGGGSLKKQPAPPPGPLPPNPIPPIGPPLTVPPAPAPGTLPDVSTFLVPGQLYLLTMQAPAALPLTGQPAIDNLAKAAADAGFAAAPIAGIWTVQTGSASSVAGSDQGTAKAVWNGMPSQLLTPLPIALAVTTGAGMTPGFRLISAGPIAQ